MPILSNSSVVQEGAYTVRPVAHLLADDAREQRGGAAAVVEPLAGLGGGGDGGGVGGGVVLPDHLVHLGALVLNPSSQGMPVAMCSMWRTVSRGAPIVGVLVPLGNGGRLVDVEATVAHEDADHGRGHRLGHRVARHDLAGPVGGVGL